VQEKKKKIGKEEKKSGIKSGKSIINCLIDNVERIEKLESVLKNIYSNACLHKEDFFLFNVKCQIESVLPSVKDTLADENAC